MNIGITFHFGFNGLTVKESIKSIKDAGFDCILTSADRSFKQNNGSIKSQIHYMKKYKLAPSSLHMRYKSSELPNFWLDNEIGTKLEKALIKDLKIAKKYGFSCVVVHLVGEYSQVGEDRLKRVLGYSRKLNVPLAIENINQQKIFLETMEHFKDEEYMKMCYDSGHNHTFDPDYDFFEKFSDKIIALHLHDNDGTADQHTLNKFGTTDWKWLAKKLAHTGIENLDYELLLYKKPDMEKDEVLNECYKQGLELAKMIEEERKNF